jgi:hypothetical protein
LVIFLVAAICVLINQAERAARAGAQRNDWVRTTDGWEPRRVLHPDITPPSPQVHPGLVAAFQLGASLLALVAFPSPAVPAASKPLPQQRLRTRRRGRAIGAAN